MIKEPDNKNLNFATIFESRVIISNVFKRIFNLILEYPRSLETRILLVE